MMKRIAIQFGLLIGVWAAIGTHLSWQRVVVVSLLISALRIEAMAGARR